MWGALRRYDRNPHQRRDLPRDRRPHLVGGLNHPRSGATARTDQNRHQRGHDRDSLLDSNLRITTAASRRRWAPTVTPTLF